MTTIRENLTAISDVLDTVPLDSYADMSPAELARAHESLERLGERLKALRYEIGRERDE